ncbi:MAG: copper chaperone PCu(A)C [Pseudomonadota bacterium]
MNTAWLLGAAVLVAACGAPQSALSTQTDDPGAATEITVSDAFVMVPLAGRDVTMGGARVELEGSAARLVGVSAPFAEVAELHTMSLEGATMRMQQVEDFDIAGGGALVLERGGDHLMFFGASGLEAGQTYPLTLHFELADGTQVSRTVDANARDLGD